MTLAAPSSRTRHRSWVMHAVLALLLLFAQQHATLHWLAHGMQAAAAKAKHAPPAGEHCEECDALASIGTGLLGGKAVLLAFAVPHVAPVAWASHVPPAAPQPLYRSRAPPSL